SSGGKVGKVTDVIFDHEAGDIRYLVIKLEKREVMLPTNRVYRSIVDEQSFETDLSQHELELLPSFNEKSVSGKEDEKLAEAHKREYKEEEKRERAEYKEQFEEGPIAHREGSNRLITPEASE